MPWRHPPPTKLLLLIAYVIHKSTSCFMAPTISGPHCQTQLTCS